jgi:RNA polymerase sigma-70 factor, ECF subfamily
MGAVFDLSARVCWSAKVARDPAILSRRDHAGTGVDGTAQQAGDFPGVTLEIRGQEDLSATPRPVGLLFVMNLPFSASAPGSSGESTWIAAAQRGDLAAYAELVRAHRASVMAYLAVRVSIYQDAEDLAQEVFVTAFRKLDTFEAGRPFGPWLRGIGLHLLRNYQRKFRAQGVGGAAELQALLDAQLDVSLEMQEEGEMLAALKECLQEVEGPAKVLLMERYVQGRTVREIARTANRGYSALTMQLHRVRESLRRCVELKMAAL